MSVENIKLPCYQSHKKVWALEIAALEIHEDKSATIAPSDKKYDVFKTKPGWANRFEGSEEDKGYWIQYEDGFTSWSPAKIFLDGYTKI